MVHLLDSLKRNSLEDLWKIYLIREMFWSNMA